MLPPPNLTVPPFIAAIPALSPVFIALPVPLISTSPPLAKAPSPFIYAITEPYPYAFVFLAVILPPSAT